MARRIFVLLIAGFSLVACGSEPQKQWYKAGENYTVSEFQRDQAACTRNKVLDEECMKQRGWIAISGDREKPAAPQQSGGPRGRPAY